MADFQIRKACLEDIAKINAIAQASFAIYLQMMAQKPYPMLDDYQKRINNGQAYVLQTEGEIAAYVVLLSEDGKILLLDAIAVAPRFQKKGFGIALMNFAEEEARRLNLAAVRLHTNEVMTENISWYKKLGYREIDRRKDKGYQRVFFEKWVTFTSPYGE